MLPLLFPLAAWSAPPEPVLALGDGIVVPTDPSAPPPSGGAGGGWAAVLADCLQERAPGRFSVVDRARPGETLASARERLAEVRALEPAWVVVSLGARELAAPGADPAAAGRELQGLVSRLREGRGASVVVVAPVAPPQPDPERQSSAEARIRAFLAAALEGAGRGAQVVDPAQAWQAAGEARGGLVAGGALSDPGEARLAAAVCDLVLPAR